MFSKTRDCKLQSLDIPYIAGSPYLLPRDMDDPSGQRCTEPFRIAMYRRLLSVGIRHAGKFAGREKFNMF